jgi:hypothetical protein
MHITRGPEKKKAESLKQGTEVIFTYTCQIDHTGYAVNYIVFLVLW